MYLKRISVTVIREIRWQGEIADTMAPSKRTWQPSRQEIAAWTRGMEVKSAGGIHSVSELESTGLGNELLAGDERRRCHG